MRSKTIDRKRVVNLRKNGFSYSEIINIVNVSKSSVSLWCRSINLTPSQRKRLYEKRPLVYAGAQVNHEKRKKEILELKEYARNEISGLTKEQFLIAGIAIYWGEGDKKGTVGVTNSDPELIRFMMKWFREVCKIPETKFRVSIYYHAGQNEEKMKKYWSSVTRVPLNQFNKSIFKKEGTGHRKNILYNGTCKIRICNENLRHRILTWIEKIHIDGSVAQW